MRSNTDRSARTAFDAVADAYEAARPRFPVEQVARVLRWAGVEPGQRVLEVGAGTGQLTRALLGEGHPVLAVEPGRQMARRLRALDGSGALRVEQAHLGGVDLRGETFPVVVAANSFHWLDPAVEHPVVAEALEPGGRLLLLWTFLLSRDDAVATLAADPTVGPELGFLDVRPDAEEHLERTARDGRAELDAAGLFRVDAWQFDRRTETRDAAGLVALVRSFANVAALPPERRAPLEQRVADVLDGGSQRDVSLDVLTCAVLASRTIDVSAG